MTKIKKILLDKSMSQKDLYEVIKKGCKTPIGKDRISKIVNGKMTNYSMHTLLKLCMALDVTPNDLLEREGFIKKECL
tara:strand:- start:3128 stop:3361 length:234 start_codon:yes stop_codon:yes gene_type:complete